MKKLITLLLTITLCVTLLFSCGKDENTETNDVRNDVVVADLAQNVLNAVSIDLLTPAGESYISLNVDINLTMCTEYCVYINPTGTADAIGIFKADSEENAESLLSQAKDYVKMLKDTWMTEYLPEETVKLENAVCKKMGLYVMYVILGDTPRNAAVDAFENSLAPSTENE